MRPTNNEWKNKPDKEGWWWVNRYDEKDGEEIVRVSFRHGIYYAECGEVGEVKVDDEYFFCDLTKWLYIPEPETETKLVYDML